MNNNEKKTVKEYIGTNALIPSLVVGDPNPDDFIAIVKKIMPVINVLELGIPFSDPIADGPAKQEANKRAFSAGVNRDNALDLIAKIKPFCDKPIVVFTYANILGVDDREKNIKRFKEAGVDGLVIADVPLEEAAPYQKLMDKIGLDYISLITPLTAVERLEKIIQISSGCLYYIPTYEKDNVDQRSLEKLKLFKEKINGRIPLLVELNMSNPQQAKVFKDNGADGVIVGPPIVKIVEQNLNSPNDMVEKILGFCKMIKE